MELDRFLITKDPPGLSEDSSHIVFGKLKVQKKGSKSA